MNYLINFKKSFDKEINSYVDKKIRYADDIDPKSSLILKIIKEFINNGGKRFRPALFYFAYRSYSNKDLKEILKLSFVFEFIQTFILIHDDIIDNSDLRRGKSTVHKKYDISTAILAGDMALMLADEIFYSFSHKKEIIYLYNELKQELLIGEYLDTIKIEDVIKIMELKTARYSFIKPVFIALSLADVNSKIIEKWTKFLKEIGILFQMKDDFEGLFGEEKNIGKPVDSDIKEGKQTLLIQQLLKRINQNEKKRFNSFFGKKTIATEDFRWLKKTMMKYKIPSHFQQEIIRRSEKIKKNIDIFFPKKEITKLINEILDKIIYF